MSLGNNISKSLKMNRNIKFKLQRLLNLRLIPVYSKYKEYTMITKEI